MNTIRPTLGRETQRFNVSPGTGGENQKSTHGRKSLGTT